MQFDKSSRQTLNEQTRSGDNDDDTLCQNMPCNQHLIDACIAISDCVLVKVAVGPTVHGFRGHS